MPGPDPSIGQEGQAGGGGHQTFSQRPGQPPTMTDQTFAGSNQYTPLTPLMPRGNVPTVSMMMGSHNVIHGAVFNTANNQQIWEHGGVCEPHVGPHDHAGIVDTATSFLSHHPVSSVQSVPCPPTTDLTSTPASTTSTVAPLNSQKAVKRNVATSNALLRSNTKRLKQQVTTAINRDEVNKHRLLQRQSHLVEKLAEYSSYTPLQGEALQTIVETKQDLLPTMKKANLEKYATNGKLWENDEQKGEILKILQTNIGTALSNKFGVVDDINCQAVGTKKQCFETATQSKALATLFISPSRKGSDSENFPNNKVLLSLYTISRYSPPVLY